MSLRLFWYPCREPVDVRNRDRPNLVRDDQDFLVIARRIPQQKRNTVIVGLRGCREQIGQG